MTPPITTEVPDPVVSEFGSNYAVSPPEATSIAMSDGVDGKITPLLAVVASTTTTSSETWYSGNWAELNGMHCGLSK